MRRCVWTVNYPAREFGVSRMDSASAAKAKCPHLVTVHVELLDCTAGATAVDEGEDRDEPSEPEVRV